jgi:hypothetical protein
MIEEKIARAKSLIEQREKIDAELASLFGLSDQPRRGRPRKEQGSLEGASGSNPLSQPTSAEASASEGANLRVVD